MDMLRTLYARLGVFISRLVREEKGASGIEYALIAAMVAVIIAVFVPTVNEKLTDIFTTIVDALGGSSGTTP